MLQIRNNLLSKGGYGALLTGNPKLEAKGEAGSSDQPEKPKAKDISHLIKRKKPEPDATSNPDVLSPAKKQAL